MKAILLVFLFSFPCFAESPSGDWILAGKEEGIATYHRRLPGSSIIALRGDGVIDAPLDKVVTILLDDARGPEWIDSLADAHIVSRRSPLDFIDYNHVSTPPIIMRDRDFVTRVTIDVDKKERSLMLHYESVETPDQPPIPKYIRGTLTDSGFYVKSVDGGSRTYLRAEMHADPKGAIPTFLVNFFQKSWAMDTMKALRKQAAKKDIRADPYFAGIFK